MSMTLDVDQAAEMMKIHPKTVTDLIASGAIPAAKIGRAYVMLTRDVMHYIDNMISQQTAQRMGASQRGRRATRAARPGQSREDSRTASSSGATCAR